MSDDQMEKAIMMDVLAVSDPDRRGVLTDAELGLSA